jgi:hypothetical protein
MTTPIPTELPGTQWIPSNGADGMSFVEHFCFQCAKDQAANGSKDYDDCEDSDLCPILAASFRDEAVQWREMDNGGLICTEFQPMESNP